MTGVLQKYHFTFDKEKISLKTPQLSYLDSTRIFAQSHSQKKVK